MPNLFTRGELHLAGPALAAAWAALGENVFNAAEQEGQTMTIEQPIAHALEES